MGKMVPPPPPRNNEELLEQIEMLKNRRRWLKAQTIIVMIAAFGLAFILIVFMFVTP